MEKRPENPLRALVRSAAVGAGRVIGAIVASAFVGGVVGGGAGWWYGGVILALFGLAIGAALGLCLCLAVLFVLHST